MLNRKIPIVLLAMLVAILCLSLPAWAEGLSISPEAPAAVNVGDNFDVDIKINEATSLGGVAFDLTFDPALLEVVEVKEGNLFNSPFEVENTFDNVNGHVKYSVIVTKSADTFTGSGTAETITFKAKAAGLATLSFSKTQLGQIGGIALPHSINTATINIQSTEPELSITQYVPEWNASNVALDAPVNAVFNMDVTAAGNIGEVTIKDGNNNAVTGVIASLNADKRTLNIAHADFEYGTEYTVIIPAGAVKNAQDAVNDEVSWSFTTKAEPVQILNVVVDLEGENVSPDRPLTIKGTASKGGSPVSVAWQVQVKDPDGNVVADYSPNNGAEFTETYTPGLDLPIVADYTVVVTASPESGDPVTVEKTFGVYNYPVILSGLNVTGTGTERTVAVNVFNLSENDIEQAKVICQVSKIVNETVCVKSVDQKVVNVTANGTKNVDFNVTIPTEPGSYKVELFVWSNAAGGWTTLGQQIEANL